MQKPKIYIHIGHSKTGSTGFQNLLTNNHENLKKNGLFYNVTKKMIIRAKNNKFQFGNLPPINQTNINRFIEKEIIDIIKNYPGYNHYLFSKENFGSNKKNCDELFNQINEYKKNYTFIFIQCWRNPLDTYTSQMIMDIKKNRTFKGKLPHGGNSYFLKKIYENGYDVKLFNYSTQKKDLYKYMLKSISSNPNIVNIENNIAYKTSNRGLTKAEIILIKIINRHFNTNFSLFLGDLLPQIFPKKESFHPLISEDEINRLKDIYAKDIIFINTKLDQYNQLCWKQENKREKKLLYDLLEMLGLFILLPYYFILYKFSN